MLVIVLLACATSDESTTSSTTPTPTDTGSTPTPTPTTPTPTETGGPLALSNLSASLHPSFGTIVVASWFQTTSADVHLEYSFDDGVWLSSPVKARQAGDQTELLLGIPYDMDVTWRVVASGGTGAVTSPDQATATGVQPPPIPDASVLVNDTAGQDMVTAPYWLVGLAQVGWFTDPWWVVIVDRAGRIVWASRSPAEHSSMHARVAMDGRSLFLDRSTTWVSNGDGGASSYVDQVKIDGSLVATFDTPGLHHPFTDMPDGSVAYGASIGVGGGDEAVQIVQPDGSTETVWQCDAWLYSIGADGGCSSNTLTYREDTNKFLFSFYTLESIIEIDRATGSVDRWFGNIDGVYAFDPVQSQFWWQHGGVITDSGTLLTSSHSTSVTNEIVVREYTIDDATDTLTEVWNLGVGEGQIADVMGEAVRLANGNTAHNTGSHGRLREVTPDKTVVWDVRWSVDLGRTMPISDLYLLAP